MVSPSAKELPVDGPRSGGAAKRTGVGGGGFVGVRVGRIGVDVGSGTAVSVGGGVSVDVAIGVIVGEGVGDGISTVAEGRGGRVGVCVGVGRSAKTIKLPPEGVPAAASAVGSGGAWRGRTSGPMTITRAAPTMVAPRIAASTMSNLVVSRPSTGARIIGMRRPVRRLLG